SLLLNLLQGASDVINGFTNGGFGPNLFPLLASTPSMLAKAIPTIFAGGLIGEFPATLDGTIPTIQDIAGLLLQLISPSEMVSTLAAPTIAAEEPRLIEDGVNGLLFAATAVSLRLITLAAPLVAPIIGEDPDDAAAFLALGALGLAGP